jgi:hypothetical protein
MQRSKNRKVDQVRCVLLPFGFWSTAKNDFFSFLQLVIKNRSGVEGEIETGKEEKEHHITVLVLCFVFGLLPPATSVPPSPMCLERTGTEGKINSQGLPHELGPIHAVDGSLRFLLGLVLDESVSLQCAHGSIDHTNY